MPLKLNFLTAVGTEPSKLLLLPLGEVLPLKLDFLTAVGTEPSKLLLLLLIEGIQKQGKVSAT